VRFDIDEHIRRASTLPREASCDEGVFRAAKERIFAKTWQLVGDLDALREYSAVPCALSDLPLLLTRDAEDRVHCLSNVCTHRGNLLAAEPAKSIRCRYHGRRFALDGRFVSMPDFEGALGFPSPADDLPRVPFGTFGKLVFASTDPAFEWGELIEPVRARTAELPIAAATR
jgi:choline monooxygenase